VDEQCPDETAAEDLLESQPFLAFIRLAAMKVLVGVEVPLDQRARLCLVDIHRSFAARRPARAPDVLVVLTILVQQVAAAAQYGCRGREARRFVVVPYLPEDRHVLG